MAVLRIKLRADSQNKMIVGTPVKDLVEIAVVVAMQVILIVIVAIATFVLYVLLVENLLSRVARIESAAELLPAMQQSFAGVLTVLLGLELLETLRPYFTQHHIRLEVVLVVAIIAVGRHVLQVDFEHTPGTVLLGLSRVILALTVGYWLVKKTQASVGVDGGPPGEAHHDRRVKRSDIGCGGS